MVNKTRKVKFLVTGLVGTPPGYRLRFRILSPKTIPNITAREGEKPKIGYRTIKEITYEASESEKDGGRFTNTDTVEGKVFPKRKAILISRDLYRMNLQPNEDHLFYLEDIARVVLNSKGKELVKLPDEYMPSPHYGRNSSRKNRPRFEVKYGSQKLEKRLMEI